MADRSGLVAAVKAEARRHLTFDELESCLTSEEALDPLGSQHLHACDACRRELADLRAFERLPARTTQQATAEHTRGTEAASRASWWTLWPRLAGVAAGLVLAAVSVSRFIPSSSPAMQVSVQLDAGSLGATAPPSTLRPGDGVELPNEVQLALARARLAAEATRQPQTLDVRVERRLYGALLTQLDAMGVVAPGASELPPGHETETLRVQLNIVPGK